MTTANSDVAGAAPHSSANALVFSVDGHEGFARGLAVSVHSALTKLDPRVKPALYILDGGVGDLTKLRMARMVNRVRADVELRWVSLSGHSIADIPHQGRYPSIVWARLLIPELLPPEIERVVYLDADLLVGRDVAPLFDEDLGTATVAAVADFGSGLELDGGERPYHNTGLLVLDLKRWRQMGLGRKVLDYLISHDAPRNVDQDAMNAVIDDWHRLDYSWNVQLGVLVPGTFHGPLAPELVQRLLRNERREGVIRHFILAKPWIPAHMAPESGRWLYASLRTRWGTPREEGIWLLRWLAGRARYHLGTARINFRRGTT